MIRVSIRAAFLFGFIWLVSGAAGAEPAVISPAQQGQWNAVGRLIKGTIDTPTGCTATLIAPDLILTAAHCAPGPDADPADHQFVAGWNNGRSAATARIAEVFLHPEHTPARLSLDNVFADLAILRLATPMTIPPMPLGPLPEDDVNLAILGYRNSANQAPVLQPGCPHILLRGDVIRLGCPVVGGNSGAPVLHLTPDGPRLVGVISATSGAGALAVRPQDWMAPLLGDLPSSNPD